MNKKSILYEHCNTCKHFLNCDTGWCSTNLHEPSLRKMIFRKLKNKIIDILEL